MLEQYVSNFLATYLGKYLRGIGTEQLGVSLWNGQLDLRNLELRPHALIPGRLPIICHRGHIGKLKVVIPWTRLASEPVVIEIEGLYVLMRPKKGAPWDEEAEQEAEKERKLKALEEFEAMREKGEEGAPEQRSYLERFQDAISNNLQLRVRNVHLRYEDCDTDPHNPVALGFTLTNAQCITTDHDWNPGFVTTRNLLHKIFSLEGWAAYVTPCPRDTMLTLRYPPASQVDSSAVPQSSLWSELETALEAASLPQNQIIDPSSITLKLRLQQGRLSFETPRVTSSIILSSLKFKISRDQYERVLQIVDYIANFEGVDKFRKFRPTVLVAGNAGRWWRYATECVLHLVRETRERNRIDWAKVKRFKHLGSQYTELYKRKQGVQWLPPLTKAEEATLQELHDEMELEHIKWFRKVAYSDLKIDTMQYETQRRLVEERKSQRKGWMSWVGGGWSKQPTGEEDPSMNESQSWTDEDRQQLSALGLIETTDKVDDLPADYIHTTTTVQIEQGEVQLVAPPEAGSGMFMDLTLTDMTFKMNSMKDAFKAIISLGNLDITDRSPDIGPYKKIARRSAKDLKKRKDLLLCVVEKNPLDGRAALAFDIQLAPLDVILHPSFVARTASFFRPPAAINLEVASVSDNLKEIAERHFDAVLRGSGAVDVSCNLDASNFIIPFSSIPECITVGKEAFKCPASGAMVVNLGGLVLDTDVSHAVMRANKLAAGNELDDDDFYDRYKMNVSTITASIAESGEEFMTWWNESGTMTLQINSASKCYPRVTDFVSPFNMNMNIDRLLTNESLNLPLMKVHGVLPNVNVKLSRQNLLLSIHTLDMLTTLVNRITPQMPDLLTIPTKGSVQGLDGYIYEQLHICKILKQVGQQHQPVYTQEANDVGSGSTNGVVSPVPAQVHGIAILRHSKLLLYEPVADESQVYLQCVFNLKRAPFKVVLKEHTVTISLPQVYGPPKKIDLEMSDSGQCRALYRSLHKLAVEAQTNSKDKEGIERRKDQTQLQMKMDLELLTMNISDDNVTSFASVSLSGFQSKVEMRSYDQEVWLRLNELRCKDTNDTLFAFSDKAEDALIDIKCLMCVEQSPYWKRDGPDTSVNLNASTLNLVLTPALVRLGELFFDLIGVNKLARDGQVKEYVAAPLHLQPLKGSLDLDPSRYDTIIVAKMEALRVTCLEEISKGSFAEFLSMAMTSTEIHVNIAANQTSVKGKFGDVIADELVGDTKRPLLRMADVTKGSLIQFHYVAENVEASVAPYVAGHVEATMQQIHSSFHFTMFQRILYWSTNGHVVNKMKQVAGRKVTAASSDKRRLLSPPPEKAHIPSVIQLKLHIVNPLVELPAKADDKSFLLASLGDVSVATTLGRTQHNTAIQQNEIRFTDLGIDLVHEGRPTQSMAGGLNVYMKMTQALEEPCNAADPLSSLSIDMGEMPIKVDEAGWGLLLQVAAHNLLSSYTPPYKPLTLAPAQEVSAVLKSRLSACATSMRITMLQSNGDIFSVLECSKLSATYNDFTDGSTKMLATLDAFTVADMRFSPPRSLVSCYHDETMLTVNFEKFTNGDSRAEVTLGRPTFYADPTSIFLVQDLLASPVAIDAFHVMLNPKQTTEKPAAPTLSTMGVLIHLNHMNVIGLEGTDEFFKLTAHDATVEGVLKDAYMKINAKIGDMHMYSLEDGITDVMGLPSGTSKSLVEVAYQKGGEGIGEGYSQVANIQLQDVRVIAVPTFWQRLGQWASAGPLAQLTMLGTSQADRLTRRMTASTDLTQVSLEWHGPHVVLPTTDGRALTATLGCMRINNCVEDGSEHFEVLFQKLRLHHNGASICLAGQHSTVEHDIMRDFDASAAMVRKIGSADSELRISSKVGKITLQLSDPQLNLLSEVVSSQSSASSPKKRVAVSDGAEAVQAAPFNASLTFEGLQLVLHTTVSLPEGSYGRPLTKLDMTDVEVIVTPEEAKLNVQSISVSDLSGNTPEGMSTVVSTESQEVNALPCFGVVLKGRDVELKLRRLHLLVIPQYVVEVNKFVENTQSTSQQLPSLPAIAPASRKVTAIMDEFTLGIVDSNVLLLSVVLDASQVLMELQPNNDYVASGTMGSLRIVDNVTMNSMYKDVIHPSTYGKENTNIVEFKVKSAASAQMEVSLTMRSLSYTCVVPFLQRVAFFISSGGVERMIGKTKVQATEMTPTEEKPLGLTFKVVALNPILVLPKHETVSDAILADLGQITFSNAQTDDTEVFTLQLLNMALSARQKYNTNIVSGTNIMVTTEKHFKAQSQADLAVKVNIEGAEAVVLQRHWQLMLSVAKTCMGFRAPVTATEDDGHEPQASPNLKLEIVVPLVSLTVCDKEGISLMAFSIQNIEGCYTSQGLSQEILFSVWNVDLCEVHQQGSVRTCRDLCYSTANNKYPSIRLDARIDEKSATRHTNAVVDMHLPHFLFVAPLLAECHKVFVVPYNEVFRGDLTSKPTEETALDNHLTLTEDLYLSPHKILRLSSEKYNSIELNGDGKYAIHLMRDPGDTRKTIFVDDGMTVRFANVQIKLCGGGKLDDHISMGEGSYSCKTGCTEEFEVRENGDDKTLMTGSPRRMLALRQEVSLRMECHFGLGIAGDIGAAGTGAKRCIMLMGHVKGEYESETVLHDEPVVKASLNVANLHAVHLPIIAPRLINQPKQNFPKQSGAAYIVDPTSAEVIVNISKSGFYLQTLIRATNLRLCLGDAELITQFLATLPQGDGSADTTQTVDVLKSCNVKLNCPMLTVTLVDDSTGTPMPVLDITLKENAIHGLGTSSNVDELEAVVSTVVRCYNSDECEWESLIEEFNTTVKRVSTKVRDAVSCETTVLASRIATNITPVSIGILGRFGAMCQNIGTTPLIARSMYVLRNECGRDICFSKGSDSEMQTLQSGCTLDFDSPFSDIVFIAVVMNPTILDGLTPPIKGSQPKKPWLSARINIVGSHTVDDTFVVDVVNNEGRKMVVFRTPVVIENHLQAPIHIEGVGVVEAATADGPSRKSVPHDRLTKAEGISVRPLAGHYKHATLGYLFCNLTSLPKKWCKYTVRCQPESAAGPSVSDYCFVAEIMQHGTDVKLMLIPLFTIENRLPVELNYALGMDNNMTYGCVKPFGGVSQITQAEKSWPLCQLVMSAGCKIDGIGMQTTEGALVWNGPPSAVSESKCDISKLMQRSNYLLMSKNSFDIVGHISYTPRSGILIYAPLWIINTTEYALEVFPQVNTVVSTIIPAASSGVPKPYTISLKHEINRLYLKFLKGDTSTPFELSNVVSGGSIVLPHPNKEGLMRHLGVDIETVTWPGSQAMTRIVKLVPRWVFHNTTPLELTLRVVLNEGTRPSLVVRSGEYKTCCSSGKKKDNLIEVRYNSDPYTMNRYSKAFGISGDADLHLRLNYEVQYSGYQPGPCCFGGPTAPDGSAEYFRVLRATTTEEKGSIHVTFRECEKPPFMIENRTPYLITFMQSDLQPPTVRHLPPRTTIPFAPDDPFVDPCIMFRIHGPDERVVGTKTIRLDKPTKDNEGNNISKTLNIYYKVRHCSSASVSVLSFANEHYLHKKPSMSMNSSILSMMLDGLGLSLSTPKQFSDVTHISMNIIKVTHIRQQLESAMNLLIGDLQVDDVTEDSPLFPVVLKRATLPNGDTTPPLLQAEMLRSHQSPDVIIIRKLKLALIPLQVKLSDKYISNLMTFYDSVSEVLNDDKADSWMKPHQYAADTTVTVWDRKAYVSSVIIEPIKVTISFTRQDEDHSAPFNKFHSQRWWLGYMLRSIDQTNIEWDACNLVDSSLPVWVIISRLRNWYLNDLRYQALFIPFSAGFMGNPAATIKGVYKGLGDLVTMPITEASKGQDVGGVVAGGLVGFTQGMTSFVKNTGTGLAGSMSSLTRSLARTTSKLTCDPEWTGNKQQHSGVVPGALEGIGGFFHHPYEGFVGDGLTGATNGLAKGTIGLFAKPITGTLQGVSNNLDLCTGRNLAPGVRMRPPKIFKSVNEECVREDIKAAKAQLDRWRHGYIREAEVKGALSWKVIAECTTWDEFHALCTVEEFYEHAGLARDEFLTKASPEHDKQQQVRSQKFDRVLHLYQTLGPAQLVGDSSLQVTPQELAYVLTWDEFHVLLTPRQFYAHSHFARDRCLLATSGFTLL